MILVAGIGRSGRLRSTLPDSIHSFRVPSRGTSLLLEVGRTAYGRDERSVPEMVYEAVTRALDDARMTRDDLDYIVTASIDLVDGKVASSVLITEVIGAVMKEEARVSDDGAAAFFHAAAMILSAGKRNVLIVAHAKNTESDGDALSEWSMDPLFMQPLAVNDLSAAALQADLWLGSGGQAEWMDRVAALRRGVSVDEVRASRCLAEPLREKHRAPACDGACAVVLTSDESRATSHVRVAGLGLCVEPHYLGDRDLIGCPAAKRAAEQAYRMSGWQPSDVEVAELSAPFAHQEILWARAMSLVASHEPPAGCRSGAGSDQDGRPGPRATSHVALNPTGGWFAGNPYVVAGLERICCAAEAVRAGQARKALAHGCWGPAGQGHAVILMEGRD